jgi:hypothetical protein
MRVRYFTTSALTVAMLTSAIFTASTVSAAPAPSGPGTNMLWTGQTLGTGQSLVSSNGRFILKVGGSVPLQLLEQIGTVSTPYRTINWAPIPWPAGYQPGARIMLRVLSTGNVVLFGKNNEILWQTHTAWRERLRLIVNLHGNLEMVDRINRRIWETGTTTRFLQSGETLHAGSSLQVYGMFTSRPARVTMQADGNLVARLGSTVRWQTGTHVAGSHLGMRSIGVLAVFAPNGAIVWSSPNEGAGARMVVGSNGSVIIQNKDGQSVWVRPL